MGYVLVGKPLQDSLSAIATSDFIDAKSHEILGSIGGRISRTASDTERG